MSRGKLRIRVLGGGWYGCHIARWLLRSGIAEVELHERRDHLFGGASGANQSRLHLGFHYPRSAETRASSLLNAVRFMAEYPDLTRDVACNLYAVAAGRSMVDFENFRQSMRASGVEFITIPNPATWGLANVEGAVQTGERLILADVAREFFTRELAAVTSFNHPHTDLSMDAYDWTIDCTFGSLGNEGIDHYEPCLMFLLRSRNAAVVRNMAVTIMDGPFCSLYPWCDGSRATLTHVVHTRLGLCATMEDAQAVLAQVTQEHLDQRWDAMAREMTHFFPDFPALYERDGHLLSVRAMPASGSDARLCSVRQAGNLITVTPGKMDAIFRAQDLIGGILKRAHPWIA